MVDDLSSGELATKIGDKYGWSETRELRLRAILVRHREQIDNLVQRAERFTSNALAVLVVVPILSIFFLADGQYIADALIRLVSTDANHQAIQAIADELDLMLRKYIRAKVILGSLSLLFYSVAMFLLGFPHAVALGILGGVLEFIPVAGWMISAAAIITFGFLTHCHWIWMAALLGLWRLVMDYFISPRVMAQNLEIHPLMVIFAVMVGGEIGGIVGIYLSIPLMVVFRVIWRRCFSSTAQVQARSELTQAAQIRPFPHNQNLIVAAGRVFRRSTRNLLEGRLRVGPAWQVWSEASELDVSISTTASMSTPACKTESAPVAQGVSLQRFCRSAIWKISCSFSRACRETNPRRTRKLYVNHRLRRTRLAQHKQPGHSAGDLRLAEHFLEEHTVRSPAMVRSVFLSNSCPLVRGSRQSQRCASQHGLFRSPVRFAFHFRHPVPRALPKLEGGMGTLTKLHLALGERFGHCSCGYLAQSAPVTPDRPWHAPAEERIEAEAKNVLLEIRM